MKRWESNTALEVLIQLVIISTAMASIGLVTRWWITGQSFPGDFLDAREAALGHFRPGYIYRDWIAFIFTPLTWTDQWRAYWYYSAVQTFAFMWLAHKMMEVPYGWVLVLVVVPGFNSLLRSGNIQILLTVAAICPLPALLAVLVKPHHAVFPLVLAVAARYRAKPSERGTRRHAHAA